MTSEKYFVQNENVDLNRKQRCFGDECYSLALGVPSLLMFTALSMNKATPTERLLKLFIFLIVFFVMGRPGYKITIPNRNIVADFFNCTWVRISLN